MHSSAVTFLSKIRVNNLALKSLAHAQISHFRKHPRHIWFSVKFRPWFISESVTHCGLLGRQWYSSMRNKNCNSLSNCAQNHKSHNHEHQTVQSVHISFSSTGPKSFRKPTLNAVKSPTLPSSKDRYLRKPETHIHYLDYMMLQWIAREISSSVHTLTLLCVIWGVERRAPTPLRRASFSMRPQKENGSSISWLM